jgi:PDZ domain-containing protein
VSTVYSESVEAAARPHPRSRPRVFRIVTPGRVLALVGLVVAGVIALNFISSDQYIFLPDKAHPVADLVQVAGGHDRAGAGGIYFVDVLVRKATMLEQLFGGLHNGADLYPADEIVPAGVSTTQENQVNDDEMRTSKQVAAAVALRAFGKKVRVIENGAIVSQTEPGFPATGKLVPTDRIVAINSTTVRSPADIFHAMSGKPIGTHFLFKVLRGGHQALVRLTTVAATAGSKRGVVGVLLAPSEKINLPVKVSIDTPGVGGPSAGLAFALDILQQLGRNVDHGHKVAATGELFLNGGVGPIGGIKQKTIGAREAGVDVFLVPVSNAAEARKYAHGLRIVPVKSFQQALHALATLPRVR